MPAFPIHHIENYTYGVNTLPNGIVYLSNNHVHQFKDVSVDGDAPKMFIGVYEKNEMHGLHKRNFNNWIKYIAKTGHKWYPIESITEHLLNRLGTCFGLKMAQSRLAIISGQLRFLSRYFLNKREMQLVHGAEIIAGYLNDSTSFVDEVDANRMSKDLFTFQFIEEAVSAAFYHQKDTILRELVKLVLFDALVGNNDRHFYNWGVITSIKNTFQPYFSPVYDTARGLFWNISEEGLLQRSHHNAEQFIKKYCNNSTPKIGWEGEPNINHFNLVEVIYKKSFFLEKEDIKELFLQKVIKNMYDVIDKEFSLLMSPCRIYMIKKCLSYRYKIITEIL